MKKEMIALIISVTIIFVFSFAFMNYNYDKLSRYPYQDSESRQLIKQYLTDEEIDYIIEYSIAPSLFVNFIKEDNFNVYHAKEYFELSLKRWQDSSNTIVNMVEETRDYMDVNSLSAYLDHYSYHEIKYWLDNKDKYNKDALLVVNAGDMSAFVDNNYTVGIRKPFNLEMIDESIPVADQSNIQVDIAIQKPLMDMCNSIKEELESSVSCAGLKVETGFISFQQQEALYEIALSVYGENADYYEFMPGHSEHQLGLAVDFIIDNVEKEDFNRTPQATWLKNNAYKFGFIQTFNSSTAIVYNKAKRFNHYRFVGLELAKYMYENNLTLKQVLNR